MPTDIRANADDKVVGMDIDGMPVLPQIDDVEASLDEDERERLNAAVDSPKSLARILVSIRREAAETNDPAWFTILAELEPALVGLGILRHP